MCLFEQFELVWGREDAARRFLWDWTEGGIICVVFFSVALGILGFRDFVVAHNLPIGDVRPCLVHLACIRTHHRCLSSCSPSRS